MIELLRLGFDDGVSADAMAEALRRHGGEMPDETLDQLAAVLARYLRAVPDAIATALAMSKDRHCGRAVAFATGPILAYVFDEEDLFPEASYGLLGMLDDAYLVHGFVAALRRMLPFVESSAVAHEALDDRGSEIVAALLPEGVAQSLLRTCESTIQVAQALFPSALDRDAAGVSHRPEVRVAAAVAAAGLRRSV